ncbi:hypothetical protein SALBM311S_01046 [Streptomyces alboniger]
MQDNPPVPTGYWPIPVPGTCAPEPPGAVGVGLAGAVAAGGGVGAVAASPEAEGAPMPDA